MIDNNLSIEELEDNYWNEPTLQSYVITTCYKARKKPIRLLSNEEVRLLIGQKIGLKYILALAVNTLKKEPLIEVEYFGGDLLLSLLRLELNDWKTNPIELNNFLILLQENQDKIEMCAEIPKKLIEKYL